LAYAQFAQGIDLQNIAGVVPFVRGGMGATNLSILKTLLTLKM